MGYSIRHLLLSLALSSTSSFHNAPSRGYSQIPWRHARAIRTSISALTPPPVPRSAAGLGDRPGNTNPVLEQIRVQAADAVRAAMQEGHMLLEVEFPPLPDKSQFEDYSNIEELDANRDWAMQFAPSFSNDMQGKLWLCFGDSDEAALALEAWPGSIYRQPSVTSITAACTRLGSDPQLPLFSGPAKAVAGALRQATGGSDQDPQGSWGEDCDPPQMIIAVQPGNCGPMEDWLNLELLQTPNCPLVVVNGALTKATNGYYPAVFFPKLDACASRFLTRFHSAYHLQPIVWGGGGGLGWLFHKFPEPWQLCVDGPQGIQTLKTFEKRPAFDVMIGILRENAKSSQDGPRIAEV